MKNHIEHWKKISVPITLWTLFWTFHSISYLSDKSHHYSSIAIRRWFRAFISKNIQRLSVCAHRWGGTSNTLPKRPCLHLQFANHSPLSETAFRLFEFRFERCKDRKYIASPVRNCVRRFIWWCASYYLHHCVRHSWLQRSIRCWITCSNVTVTWSLTEHAQQSRFSGTQRHCWKGNMG